MVTYRYETHKMPDPLLPFIYHRRFEIHCRDNQPNWHENIEILQAIEGNGYAYCGGESVSFSAGQLLVINADTLHSFGTEGRLVYRCLIVDNSFFLANGIPVGTLQFQQLIQSEQVFALFDRVADAYAGYNSADFRTVLAIRSCVLQLLQALCADHITVGTAQNSNEQVKRAIVYIRKHLSDPLTLDSIADHVGMSKFHLARQFKVYTGKTVVQTVNLMRCTEAQRLMEGGMRVGAAAASCGFDNLSYFTRTFKRLMGALPSSVKTK